LSFAKWKSLLPRKSDSWQQRRFYRKLLALALLIAGVPGLIIGLGIYFLGGREMESELQKLHQNQIQQRAANLNDQFSYLELSFSHWAFDPRFDENLRTFDVAHNFEGTRDLFKTLLVMQGMHPLISRVELYVDEPRPLLFDTDRYTFLKDEKQIQLYQSLLGESHSLYWVLPSDKTPEAGISSDGSIALVHKIPGGSMRPFGEIIGKLDEGKVIQMLNTLTPYNGGATLLLKNRQEFILSENGARPSPLDSALIAGVREHGEDSGSFLFDWNGSTYSVSFGQINRLGTPWTYVSAAPVSLITKPVVLISQLVLWVSIAGLLLALLLSWFASRRLYSPVDRVVRLLYGKEAAGKLPGADEFELIERQWHDLTRESQTLQNRLEEQLPHLKEGFLLQMVQGYLYSFSEEDLRERMVHYGWEVEDRHFVALVIQLTGFAQLEGRFSQGDEDLVTFAAANIVQEIAGGRIPQSEVINFHDLSIGLLIAISAEEAGRLEQILDPLCDQMLKTIHAILRMEVTIAISKSSTAVKYIPYLFEEAKQALSYRSLREGNQIIHVDRLPLTSEGAESAYPFPLEKEIIHAIRMGLETETNERIAQFLDELSASGAKERIVQQGMLQLLGSIQHAILQSGMSPSEIYGGANLYEQLIQLKDPDSMLQWFRQKVVRPFIQELSDKQDLRMKQMVEKVMAYVKDHYMSDISLDLCAEITQTNSYTLSKAFKQVTGLNFIDYLTGIRMEKAKELLRDTELKISDVAEQVGYQQSYFNRAFKKYEGVTPSQFRETSRRT
jgi:AraC-like DNA-binding protein